MDFEISGNLNNANYIHENGFFVGNHSKCIIKNLNFLSNIFEELL